MRIRNHLALSSYNLEWFKTYSKGLKDQGLSPTHPLYRYFVNELFHDGDLFIRNVDPVAHQVVLNLSNVWAMDKVSDYLTQMEKAIGEVRVGKRKRKTLASDYRADVTFRDVSHFSLNLGQCEGALDYQCCRLRRIKGKNVLDIRFIDQRSRAGFISITFADVSIENIAPRLRKYLQGKTPKGIVYPEVGHETG